MDQKEQLLIESPDANGRVKAQNSAGPPGEHPISRKRLWLGIGAVALAGALFGVQGIMGKFAYSAGSNVPTLLVFRFVMASATIWAIVAILKVRRRPVDLRQPPKRVLGFGFLGLLWITNSLFYFLALELLPASTNSLLVFIYPALVVLWSFLFFKERMGWLKVGALALAIGGCFLTVDPFTALSANSSFSFLGALLALLSALSNSWYAILAGKIGPSVSGLVKAAYSLPVTAVCFTLYILLSGTFSAGMTADGWILCIIIGILTGFSIYLYLIGVISIGASQTAIISTTEPGTAIFLGALLLAEPVTLTKLLGSLCIAGAILLLSRVRQV